MGGFYSSKSVFCMNFFFRDETIFQYMHLWISMKYFYFLRWHVRWHLNASLGFKVWESYWISRKQI